MELEVGAGARVVGKPCGPPRQVRPASLASVSRGGEVAVSRQSNGWRRRRGSGAVTQAIFQDRERKGK